MEHNAFVLQLFVNALDIVNIHCDMRGTCDGRVAVIRNIGLRHQILQELDLQTGEIDHSNLELAVGILEHIAHYVLAQLGTFVNCLGQQLAAQQVAVKVQALADTLRFHIRADSDSPADQTAKLAVRDAILAYTDAHCTAQDKPAALRWAAENLPALELTARAVLAGRGIFSTVTVQLVEMYFDTTRYSTGILPAGRYQALRIDLGGNARHGKNWWCVLYPGLCRSACGTYALPEENDLVCGGYVVRFKCVEWWQRVTASREDQVLVETASPSQARSKDGEGKKRYGTPPHCAAYAVVEGV